MARKTRDLEKTIEIDAPPSRVWKALTEGEELSRWFSFEARSTPGVGGSIFLSWGPECEGEGKIEIWEPDRHIRVRDEPRELPAERHPDGVAGPYAMATDYHLEGRGGKTVLRVVTSGFGTDASWDDQYDSMSRGWEVFLRNLAWYVERHFGTPRLVAFAEVPFQCSLDEGWKRILGSSGLAREGSVDDLDEGAGYRVVTSTGDELRGTVQVWNPPKDLAVTVENLNDAHLWVELTAWGEEKRAKLTLSTYGVPQGVVSLTKEKWQKMLDELFTENQVAA